MCCKVLQVSSAYDFGGGERHLTELCRALAARGHEIHLAHRPGAAWVKHLPSTVTLHALPLRNALDVFSARRLSRILKENRIGLIHAHLARDYPLSALAARLCPSARLIVTRHVMFPLNGWHKFTLGRAARVIAVSAAVAGRLNPLVAPGKIRIIHNGIDLTPFAAAPDAAQKATFCARWDINPAHLLVGALGDLRPLKGPDDFLRAAARVAATQTDVTFLLAGPDTSGADRARLDKLAAELDLTKNLRFLGWLDDPAEFYRALDVFVSASRTESFGLTLAEAMASGATVVATRTDGAQELIEDTRNGRLTPVGEPTMLAALISQLLARPAERERLGRTARADASERFSLERMARETETVYQETLTDGQF
jgi:glycosyltransferase involved in cell wall biosynthesis